MKKALLIPVLLLVVQLFGGCFIYNPAAEFVRQRYTNTVSYFNTFYNADRLFTEAEDEVLKARKEFFDTPNQTRVFTIPATARTKFTASIEKNSKVLSFYPNSKWVDDALLMIGKAYYYTDDDVRAERKFQELAAQYPASELVPEAQLWLGRSMLRQKRYDQAITLLESLIEQTNETDDEIAGSAAYELGQYFLSRREHEKAQKYFSQSLTLLDDGETLAQVQFQIAQCYDSLRQYPQSEAAYTRVGEFNPGYTLLFNADLSRVKSIARQGRYDEALEILADMLTDTKNTDFFGSINLEIANTLMAKGLTGDALQKYIYIDTAFARTDNAARSYFALAQYFETVDINYDSARNYYQKAKLEFPSSPVTLPASMKYDVFAKYDLLRKDLIRFDTLLVFTHRQKIVDDSLAAVVVDTVKGADSTEASVPPKKAVSPGKKSVARKDSLPPVDSTKIKVQFAREQTYRTMVDSLQRSIIRTKFEFGGLFFVELQIADSALFWFTQVAVEHPQSEFAPRALYTIAEIYRSLQPKPQDVRDSLYRQIIAMYPNSEYAQESRKILGLPLLETETDPAQELFEKAELLAEEKQYGPAVAALRDLIRQYPASPLKAQAVYSIGWHYENALANNDSAIAVYQRLLTEFPATPFAAAVRTKVTEHENEVRRVEQEKQKLIDEQKQKLIDEQKKKEQAEKEKKESVQTTPPVPSDSLATPKRQP